MKLVSIWLPNAWDSRIVKGTVFLIFIIQLINCWSLSPSRYSSPLFTNFFQRCLCFTEQSLKAPFGSNTFDEFVVMSSMVAKRRFSINLNFGKRKNRREPGLESKEVERNLSRHNSGLFLRIIPLDCLSDLEAKILSAQFH